MTSQQFFLRWDNYSNYISYAFGTLRNQEDLVDVTLSCEGKKIRAHKVLLSACSTYFRDVFKDNPCQHPVIVFKNVRFDDLLAIVEFMYQGEVSVVQDSLSSFLNTAELLSVQGLTEGGSGSGPVGTNPVHNNTTTVIDTLTMPKTVTLKTPQAQQIQHQQQIQQQQQTVTLVPTTTETRRFAAKKVYPGQTTATTIKTVTHPITVFSPKTTTNLVQGNTTKRHFVATAPVVKLTTNAQSTTTHTLLTTAVNAMGEHGLLDTPTQQPNTTTIHLQEHPHHHQLQHQQPQILNSSTTLGGAGQTTMTTQTNTPGGTVKRKRILFDSEENISIEDVNYVKQQIDLDSMPDYIEIQTTSAGGGGGGGVESGMDEEKTGMSAEELMSAGDEEESDSQAHGENVIIEEGE